MAIQRFRSRLVLSQFAFVFFLVSSCGEDTEPINELKKSPKEEAKNLYTLHCASCHGMDGKLGGSGAKDLTRSKLSNTELIQIITNGKNNMPAMKDVITESEKIKNLADFVKTLRK